jgi:peptidoglycan hydrolase-like protein with peptidoglycan-binding domain
VAQARDPLWLADDDFAWLEPAFETAPTVPATLPPPVRRRRRPARTLAGDLELLRGRLGRDLSSVPLGGRAVLAIGFLAALIILALVLIRPFLGDGSDTAPRQVDTKKNLAAVPAVETPAKVKTLEPGDQTAGVADLQTALGALGFYAGAIDGDYGEATSAAVLAFQSEHGLTADGVAGPSTMEALGEAVSAGARADATTAQKGLETAAAAGRISDASLTQVKEMLDDSVSRLGAISPGRVAAVAPVFHDVAVQAPDYNGTRALALFSMLKKNVDFRATHGTAAPKDIRDANGIVYRQFVANHGYQFHPIAAFARLNSLARRGKREAVARLAPALAERGVRSGSALVWEYYFPFGGPPRWSSGFAQAIAAQALARSGELLGDTQLLAEARAAFRGLERGLLLVPRGMLWIREYSFSDMAILNAHLQSLISLREYEDLSHDPQAAATIARLDAAAQTLLPEFDTGCWSRYSLGGSPASLHYHTYHVSLLKQLAAQSGEALWSDTAARWQGYLDAGQC